MTTTAARELIAFGPTESFTFPIPAGFVRQRASVGAASTIESELIRIDHYTGIGLAASVIFVDDAGACNYDLAYRVMVSSDGIDGATGSYKNPVMSPYAAIVAGAVVPVEIYPILPLAPLTFPAVQAIQLRFINNGGVATAEKVSVAFPFGKGLHVRVHGTQP
jgi:hypothetical protein